LRGKKGASRPRRFNDVTNSIDLTLRFWQSPDMTRLLVEIVIIAAVIALGWNTPFKDWTDQAHKEITSTLDSIGGSLQKNQDSSVRRYDAGRAATPSP
jgi:Tfp pilus assembly protein PilO